MHRIYETKSFVLSSFSSGEADRQLVLYTREFGLIWATAKGLREIKSKLRYSLQNYSLSTVNLVKGRSGWRVTNARLDTNYYFTLNESSERKLVLARVNSLLRRLVQGQDSNVSLFDALEKGFSFLISVPERSISEAELLLVLCILYHLGYLGDSVMLKTLLSQGFWNVEAVVEVARTRQKLIQSVNESLRSSHL